LDLVLTEYGFDLIRVQNYCLPLCDIYYWFRMLSVAASCRFEAQNLPTIRIKNNNYFFSKRERKKSKRRKKDMQVQKQCSGGCQGFLEKYYPERSGGVEIFSKTRRA
jgi:hypothetical protein